MEIPAYILAIFLILFIKNINQKNIRIFWIKYQYESIGFSQTSYLYLYVRIFKLYEVFRIGMDFCYKII